MLGNAATRVGSEGSRRAHHMHGWALDGGRGRLHGRRRARRVVFPLCALETRNPPRSPSSTIWEGTRRGRARARGRGRLGGKILNVAGDDGRGVEEGQITPSRIRAVQYLIFSSPLGPRAGKTKRMNARSRCRRTSAAFFNRRVSPDLGCSFCSTH